LDRDNFLTPPKKKNAFTTLKKEIERKGKELWYQTYAPHIILGTNKSLLNEIYAKSPHLKIYK